MPPRTFPARPGDATRRSIFGQIHPTLPARSFATDDELLASLLREDSDPLWRLFLARFEGLVFATILRAARARCVRLSEEEVDDLRAGFVAHLLANDRRALRTFDPARGIALASWIAMLAERHTITCLRARRARVRHRGIDAPHLCEGLHARAPSPEELLARKQLLSRLRGALGALCRRQRELFDLLFDQGLGAAEIAARMGTTIQTVHACRHKMELRLKQAVHGPVAPVPEAA